MFHYEPETFVNQPHAREVIILFHSIQNRFSVLTSVKVKVLLKWEFQYIINNHKEKCHRVSVEKRKKINYFSRKTF